MTTRIRFSYNVNNDMFVKALLNTNGQSFDLTCSYKVRKRRGNYIV